MKIRQSNISWLGWEQLGVPQEKLRSISGEKGAWNTMRSTLPLHPGLEKVEGWTDGLSDHINCVCNTLDSPPLMKIPFQIFWWIKIRIFHRIFPIFLLLVELKCFDAGISILSEILNCELSTL